MGKKKKKNINSGRRGGCPISQKQLNLIADHLESYVDGIDNLFILEGKEEGEVEKSEKRILKACKYLRAGEWEKVIDKEKYYEVYGDLDFDD